MGSRREAGVEHPLAAFSKLAVVAGLPVLLVLAAPFALAGVSFATEAFFFSAGCSVFVVLATLAARLLSSKVQFVGAFVLLACFAMLFRFVPPFEWQYLGNLAQGAYAGCLLSILLVSGRASQLPER